MKTTVLFLSLLIITSFVFAQQKYYRFCINDKYGITDTLGNEAIKPSYKFATLIPAKNQIYLQDFSAKPDIIFNTKTGAKQLYERVYDSRLYIKGVPYAQISNKNKVFLLSEKTEKTIPLTRDYTEFSYAGKYIIAQYNALDPFVSGGKDKNGNFLPPKIREIKRHFVVLSDDESLKTIVDRGFNSYLQLFKIAEEKKNDGMVQTVTLNLDDFKAKANPNFDYIILSQGDHHKLYNPNMVLLKTFVLAKADDEKLHQFSEKALGMKLSVRSAFNEGMVSAPPMMAPRTGMPQKSDSEAEEMEAFKPFLYVKKLDNGITIFALQETKEISKRIFETDVNTNVRLYERDSILRISIKGKEDSRFSYHPKTGEIYLPKPYLAELGIKLL